MVLDPEGRSRWPSCVASVGFSPSEPHSPSAGGGGWGGDAGDGGGRLGAAWGRAGQWAGAAVGKGHSSRTRGFCLRR